MKIVPGGIFEQNFGSLRVISSRSSEDIMNLVVFSVMLQHKGNLDLDMCLLNIFS